MNPEEEAALLEFNRVLSGMANKPLDQLNTKETITLIAALAIRLDLKTSNTIEELMDGLLIHSFALAIEKIAGLARYDN